MGQRNGKHNVFGSEQKPGGGGQNSMASQLKTRITSYNVCYTKLLRIWNQQELVGAIPLYLKTNSWGEFVFDHWWAQLAEEYQVNYYPKLVGMSPATPSVGFRFLIADGTDKEKISYNFV